MQLGPRASARQRALFSLHGLSVGDALGERFFGPPGQVVTRIQGRVLPPGPWRYTDDTEMALSIVHTLLDQDRLDPDLLERQFAERYDPSRGYGGGAHQLLQAFQRGAAWQQAAPAMFGGSGSFGNGAAMRVAPAGAYFADEASLEQAAEAARLSARVTHAHPEGVAGAVAVAVAAAVAWQQAEAGALRSSRPFGGRRSSRRFAALRDEAAAARDEAAERDARALLDAALAHTPAGETRQGLERAARLSADTPAVEVARALGSGQRVSAQDTVPFVIWCAAHHLASFEEAFWATVSGLGDRDTTCAMVCGIVALSARQIPDAWLASREALPPGFAFEGE